ncbi:MAG: tetratricopeptide repeat protein [Ignavibacteria bacterium]|nr:tetratricopeptide repeat protein [Ignavibacteria bacterium]
MIPRIPVRPFPVLLFAVMLPAVLLFAGCGSGQEAQMEELSMQNMRMRYAIDSVMSANRKLMQQVEALAAENRSLTARSADLEVRLREMQTPLAPPPPPEPMMDPGAGYAAALSQYMTRDFSGAMLKFEALLKEGIREDLADNCHYWIGECLYGMGRYSDAIHHFETALAFAQSEKKDDSTLMIANSYAAMGNKTSAKDWYNRLINGYPASPYVPKAKSRVAGL